MDLDAAKDAGGARLVGATVRLWAAWSKVPLSRLPRLLKARRATLGGSALPAGEVFGSSGVSDALGGSELPGRGSGPERPQLPLMLVPHPRSPVVSTISDHPGGGTPQTATRV